jgi:hypothetical protein
LDYVAHVSKFLASCRQLSTAMGDIFGGDTGMVHELAGFSRSRDRELLLPVPIKSPQPKAIYPNAVRGR